MKTEFTTLPRLLSLLMMSIFLVRTSTGQANIPGQPGGGDGSNSGEDSGFGVDYMGRTRNESNGKRISCIAPIAEFDKTSPSIQEDVFIIEDKTPPTEAVDDLEMDEADVDDENRQYDDDDDFTTCNWMEYVLVVVLSCTLLVAATILVLFWTLYSNEGYGWHDTNPTKQFNLHPTLMIAGFVTISGFSMLLYRISRCCRHIFVKLFHTFFHVLAIPCIGLGFFAVFDYKMLQGHNHFYSLHSWMGLVTMGMFALQFVFGFFSFLVLLCCKGATVACRGAFVPIHASFGTTIFMLAVATCLTGLTQKSSKLYNIIGEPALTEESFVINVLAMVLISSAIIVSYMLSRVDLKYHDRILVDCEEDILSDISKKNEVIIVNALAMVLVALGILVPYIVNRHALRVNKGSIISERL